MELSEKIDQLAAALVKAQPTVKAAKMDCVNPFFKSKYADLASVWEAVTAPMAENGLTVTQFPDSINGEPALTTMLIHQSGQWMKATYPLVVAGKDENAQGYGSAITYARRYGLSAVLGVIADADDDGNSASKPAKPPQRALPPDAGAHNVPAQSVNGVIESALKPFAPKPKLSAKEWGQNLLANLRLVEVSELDEALTKNAAALVKLRVTEPVLHGDIIRLVQSRQELGK